MAKGRASALALAAASLAWVPAAALAAHRAIAPSALIHGQPVHSGEGSAQSTAPRVVPLRVANAGIYASEKRQAAQLLAGQLAGAKGPVRAAGARGAGSGPGSRLGIAAAVFGPLNAAGLSAVAEGGNNTPPDTTGAIGPNDYVEMVNSEVAAYDRTSLAPVGSPVTLATFTGGTAICDPQIKYDPQTERWFYLASRCDGTTTTNTLYLGFSKTSDPTNLSTAEPTGGWCGYEYPFGAVLEDYPKLGLDALHIIIGANSYSSTTEEFMTAHILSLPKHASGPITTCPTAPELTTFGSKAEPLKTSVAEHRAFTPEPATVADSSPNGYVVAADEGGKNIMIWQVAGTASAPELKPLGAPAVTSFSLPPNVPQPGSTDPLDSLDGRLTQAVAAADPNASGEEAVWTQHTIAGGAGSVVRWYELLPGKLQVKQTGTISEPSKFVFNGAIAPTLSGGAVIDYNTGSSTAQVEIMAQSRIASAPAGTMNTPILLGSSAAVDADFSCPSQTAEVRPCRWGDYAGVSVDPTNGNVVWGSSQVNGPTALLSKAQWATQNFALTANDLAPAASFTISPNPATAGSPVGFSGIGSSDPDGTITVYSWNFGDGSATGSGAASSHTYGSPGTYTVTLTVTDNGGEANATSHQIAVAAAPRAATAAAAIASNSNFTALGATVNPTTGAITFTESVGGPGTFSWLLTFQNGKFGVFASRNTKCKKGFLRLNGNCRPAKIVFARGSKTIAAAGTLSFTVKPGASALKALRNALKQRKGLPVTMRLTFQSSRGGRPVSSTRSLIVRLKKKK